VQELSAVVDGTKKDAEKAHVALLRRLFPDVDVADSCAPADGGFEAWAESFASAAKKTTTVDNSSSSKTQELEDQLAKYESVLATTVILFLSTCSFQSANVV